MHYSVIDVEGEASELLALNRSLGTASADIICWRIAQILTEVEIGSKQRNDRILTAMQKVEVAIALAAGSKNKKDLEIMIRNKKEEIEKLESQGENLALSIF